jgi:hypothetical protein
MCGEVEERHHAKACRAQHLQPAVDLHENII